MKNIFTHQDRLSDVSWRDLDVLTSIPGGVLQLTGLDSYLMTQKLYQKIA